MSQRSTSPLKRSTVRRTLQRFWDVTRTQPLIVFLSVFSSAGYIFLLTFANTYVMALIVDRVQAGPVAGDQVFEVFGPYILALVLVNLVGQILSKLQDYTVYKLEIAGNYHLARLCFDTLSNQSMTFHTSRFGGSLVSQTSRFMSGYTGLVDVTVYSLIPTITVPSRFFRKLIAAASAPACSSPPPFPSAHPSPLVWTCPGTSSCPIRARLCTSASPSPA